MRGLEHGFTTDRGRARGVGAAAVGRCIGITRDHPHLLHRHAEHAGRDLPHHGIDALPLLRHAHGADDAAARLELDRAGVLRSNRGAAGAVISARPRGRSLDEGGNADPAMNAVSTQPRLLVAQRGIVHPLHQRLETALVRHVHDLDPGRRDPGIGIVGHDVAAPDLDRIEADCFRRPIHQRFADGVADRMADGAVLRRRHLVEIDHARLGAIVLVCVGPARDVENLVGLEHAGAGKLRIGAGARKHIDVERLDFPRLAHSHARGDEVLARMNVRHERLRAGRR